MNKCGSHGREISSVHGLAVHRSVAGSRNHRWCNLTPRPSVGCSQRLDTAGEPVHHGRPIRGSGDRVRIHGLAAPVCGLRQARQLPRSAGSAGDEAAAGGRCRDADHLRGRHDLHLHDPERLRLLATLHGEGDGADLQVRVRPPQGPDHELAGARVHRGHLECRREWRHPDDHADAPGG